jgi:hypothetical protein
LYNNHQTTNNKQTTNKQPQTTIHPSLHHHYHHHQTHQHAKEKESQKMSSNAVCGKGPPKPPPQHSSSNMDQQSSSSLMMMMVDNDDDDDDEDTVMVDTTTTNTTTAITTREGSWKHLYRETQAVSLWSCCSMMFRVCICFFVAMGKYKDTIDSHAPQQQQVDMTSWLVSNTVLLDDFYLTPTISILAGWILFWIPPKLVTKQCPGFVFSNPV